MTLHQRVDWLYEPRGQKYPELTLTVRGVHDVGRVLATLARGNCEHASLAYDCGRVLNRTADGRATLAYLEGHGGPKLGPGPCEPCEEGNHADCSQLADEVFEVCGCYEAVDRTPAGLLLVADPHAAASSSTDDKDEQQ